MRNAPAPAPPRAARLHAPPILPAARPAVPRAPVTCPDCGGPMWKLDAPARFRCRIGHAYDEPVMLAAKTEEAVRALQIAVRTLDERARLLSEMAYSSRQASRELTAEHYMLR